MIVRISGEGQFEVPDGHLDELNRLDEGLTKAVDSGDEADMQPGRGADAGGWSKVMRWASQPGDAKRSSDATPQLVRTETRSTAGTGAAEAGRKTKKMRGLLGLARHRT